MRNAAPVRIALAALLALFLLLSGCAPPGTPSAAWKTGGGSGTPAQEQNQFGVYLASLIILELNSDYGVALAVEPQVSSFPAGDVQFSVLNKWVGLAPGAHREAVRAISPGGATLQELGADFEVEDGTFSVASVEVFQLSGLQPGLYWLEVELDRETFARYPFLVIPAE